MKDEDFDQALVAVSLPKNRQRIFRGRIQRRLDEQLTLAMADPEGWTRANREGIRRTALRPRVRERLNEECPEFTDAEHGEFLAAFVEHGVNAPVGEWSDEKKAKWHKWIQRAIPVLKVIAAIVPPPYNLAVIAFIVVLTLIDKNRLTPKQLATIMIPDSTGESAVPAIAV